MAARAEGERDGFARQTLLDVRRLVEGRHVQTYSFRRRSLEKTLGRFVPARDAAVGVEEHNRLVIEGVDGRSELRGACGKQGAVFQKAGGNGAAGIVATRRGALNHGGGFL